MADERYTLEEAQRLMDLKECRQWGHDLEQLRTGEGETIRVFCGRCGDNFLPTTRTKPE